MPYKRSWSLGGSRYLETDQNASWGILVRLARSFSWHSGRPKGGNRGIEVPLSLKQFVLVFNVLFGMVEKTVLDYIFFFTQVANTV